MTIAEVKYENFLNVLFEECVINKTTLSKVEGEFFTTKNIAYKVMLEGAEYDRGSKKLTLGCIAGLDISLSNLFHEMGHMVQCKTRNLRKFSWGLRYKTFIKFWDAVYEEPRTCQDVRCEIDVIAWQAVLEYHFTGSIKKSIDNLKSLVFLKGYYAYPGGGKNRKNRIRKNFYKLYKQRNIEMFKAEWERRLKLLRR